jgi:hypothetical protein
LPWQKSFNFALNFTLQVWYLWIYHIAICLIVCPPLFSFPSGMYVYCHIWADIDYDDWRTSPICQMLTFKVILSSDEWWVYWSFIIVLNWSLCHRVSRHAHFWNFIFVQDWLVSSWYEIVLINWYSLLESADFHIILCLSIFKQFDTLVCKSRDPNILHPRQSKCITMNWSLWTVLSEFPCVIFVSLHMEYH